MFLNSKKLVVSLLMFWVMITLAFAGNSMVNKTKVIYFKPTQAPVQERRGFCWMNSTILNRPDAWRCMVMDSIYDPCFFVSSVGKVVCGLDPNQCQEGFALKLIQPLPSQLSLKERSDNNEGRDIWLIKLADGRVCSPCSGTSGVVKINNREEIIKYTCESKSAKAMKRVDW